VSFEAFHFSPRIAAAVKALGYQEPTPIQEQAIPKILKGNDVMGLAQTGTGKTAAFALPIIQRLLKGPRGRVRALILAPTRELAEQIRTDIHAMSKNTNLHSLSVYGGVNINPQIKRLQHAPEIIVACPGRLLDHINRGTIDLSHVEVLVLDEADRMCDMGFLPDIRRILKHVQSREQTLFFSATMPNDIRRLSRDMLDHPVTVQIGHTAPAETVSHALYPVAQHLKTELLLEMLYQYRKETDSVLVFTRTKYRAKRLAEKLAKAGYTATALQGNLSQNRRRQAIEGFRGGKFKILVATDIAARGIDVSQISHVINFDMPDTADAYTHRIGRTGRAEKTGCAFTFTTKDDEPMVRTIERLLKEKLERRSLPNFNYDVAPRANQSNPRATHRPNRRQRQARRTANAKH